MKQKIQRSLLAVALIFVITSVANVTFAAKTQETKVTPNTIVATVKGKSVRIKDLESMYRSNPQLQQVPFAKALPLLLQQYIVMKLIAPNTKSFYRKMKSTDKKVFNQAVQTYRSNLLTTLYLENRFNKKNTITDKAARDFYNAGVKQGGFKQPPQIELADVTLKNKSDALKFAKQLKAGKNLTELVKTKPYSGYVVKDAEGNPINNTPDGLVRLDVVQAEVQKEAKKMSVGSVSKPIALNGNFIVFKVLQKVPEQKISFAKAKDAIKARLMQQEVAQKTQEYIQNLLQKAIKPKSGKPTVVIKLGSGVAQTK